MTRLLSVICILFCAAASARSAPPSVLLITVDGMGWGDFSALGNSDTPTPRLDQLLAESAVFRDFHVSPLDAPSRAALLTGMEPLRLGIYGTHSGRNLLREGVTTIASHFRRQGWQTALFGAWGLGDHHPCRPTDHGYTTVITHRGATPAGASDFLSNDGADDLWIFNGEPAQRSGTYLDVCFGAAQDYVEKMGTRPFFLHIAPALPLDKAADAASRSPWIKELDKAAGELLDSLKAAERLDSTLIILTSTTGKHRVGKGRDLGFNAGRRGGRGVPYEGGHCVPLLIRWPAGGIAPASLPGLAMHCDLLPTLAELTGQPLPGEVKPDGLSLAGRLLRGEPPADDRVCVTEGIELPVPVQWRQSCVLQGPWRLINGRELYDLRNDPGQRRDLAATNKETVDRLRALADTRWATLAPAAVEPVRTTIGGPQDPVPLHASEWTSRSSTPITRDDILRGVPANGQWLLHIATPGKYDIVLRRWPMTVNRTLSEGFFTPTRARLRLGTADQQQPVTPEAASVTFTLDLKPGPATLQTWLIAEDGKSSGAYYVECRRSLEVRAATPITAPATPRDRDPDPPSTPPGP